MALLDFLKNKKEKEKAADKKAKKVSAEPKIEKVEVVKAPKADKNAGKYSYSVVREPHISEKGTQLAEVNKYVFKVYERSNKPEIKKSIEGLYGVNVLAVNIVKTPAKKRRLGKTEGFKKGYKRAVVTIKAGQKIEIF